MDIQQIAMLMKIIEQNYQDQLNKLDGSKYYENLKMFIGDKDYYEIASNLKKHIETSPYLPKISDLLGNKNNEDEQRPNVPNAKETIELLAHKEQLQLSAPKPTKEELKKVFAAIDGKLREAQKNAKRRLFDPFKQ